MERLPEDIERKRLQFHQRIQKQAFESYMRRGWVPELWKKLVEASSTEAKFAAYVTCVLGYKSITEMVEAKGQETATSHTTTHYVWRTQQDEKVRAAHGANDGRIFAWDSPPSTGHPGEDYGCRCWAEAYGGDLGSLINDPPIESIYPELLLFPLANIGRQSVRFAISLLRQTLSSRKLEQNNSLTEHGAIRTTQRGISKGEIEEAIRTAKERGSFVEKIGKYGTPQIKYEGKNGIIVIVEKSGRNAGRIITLWRMR
jgi:SPP1 gp7 family putative phage head morphogenesis protein